MIRWAVAAVVAAAMTWLWVLPYVLQIDLVPVRFLAHPLIAAHAMKLSYILPLIDALLVWVWAAWALGSAARWWLLRRPAETSAQRCAQHGGVTVGRVAFWLLATVSLIPAVLAAAALPVEIEHGFGAEYRRACSGCHPAQRAFAFRRSPEAWALTIERHRHFAPERFDDASAAAALDYLVAKRSLSGADLFRVKCLACHRESAIRSPRTTTAWKRVVERIGRFHPFFLSPMERHDLIEYLTAELPAATPWDRAESARRNVFEEGCARCHSLDVVMTEGIDDDAWPEILDRMAGKVPGLLDDRETRELADWILAWRRQPTAFANEFPHHDSELFFRGAYQ